MRINKHLAVAGLAAMLALWARESRASLEVTASVHIQAKADFEAPLAAHGSWVEVGSYGRVWRPGHVAVGWRPYCSGEWVWTDCGWYWSSDEPWAWACYHYGRWAYDPAVGWVWVPEVEWAPAWVSWRSGGGYIGWAPLPPPGRFFARHAAPDDFVFVGTARFGEPVRPGVVIVKNATLISHTAEIGGMARESRSLPGADSQKVIVNRGPDVAMVSKASSRSFKAVPIQEAARRNAGHEPSREVRNSQQRTRPEEPGDRGADHNDGAPGNSDSHGSAFGGERGGGRSHGGGHGRH